MTVAVSEAVRERLERVRGKSRKGIAGAHHEDRKGVRPTCGRNLIVRSTTGSLIRRKRTAEMIIDSSAIIAVLRNEPDAPSMIRCY